MFDPVAVLHTALLCIKKRTFPSQNKTILIKYKYKDLILLFGGVNFRERKKNTLSVTKFTRGPFDFHKVLRNKKVCFNHLLKIALTNY